MLCSIFLLILSIETAVCVRNPPPVFASEIMHNITAVKGEDVEFRCKVDDRGRHMVAFIRAENPPRLIAFDNKVFRNREKYEVIVPPNLDEWILKVKNVQEADVGGYTCQLNSNPVLTKTAFLELKIPPTVSRSSTPSAVEVREGHNVTLTCHAHGNPRPTVVWRRADRQIIRFNGATGYGASVHNGTKLHLTKVSRKHMSEYVCVASNGIPPDESWTVKLHVTFEPIVIPQTTVVEARRGSLVRLVCNIESWPRALVTWYHNDLEIFDSNRYATEQAVAEKYKSVHVLEIKQVEEDQFGRYKCVAGNDYGKHYAEIRLIEAASWPQSNSIMLTEGSGNDPEPDTEADDVGLESNLIESANRRRSQSARDSSSSSASGNLHYFSAPELRQPSHGVRPRTPVGGSTIAFCACWLFARALLPALAA